MNKKNNGDEVIATVNRAFDSGVANSLASIPVNSAPSFVMTGIVTTNIDGYSTGASSVALQANGKILLAGESYYDFAIIRYNANGTLDTSFSGDGIVKTDFSNSYDLGSTVAVLSNGKFLVAGISNSQFALARYNSNGSLDTSFSGDGKVTTDFGANFYYVSVNDMAVQADGKIVLAGTSGSGLSEFTLVRYNSNGSLDTSFSGDGIVTTDVSYYDTGRSVTLQNDHKILVAGSSYKNAQYDFTLIRYNANGTLDTSFDGDGIVTTDFGPDTYPNNYDHAFSVKVQADNKILVAGTNAGSIALARYNSNGSLDTSFDGDGKLITNIGANDYGYKVVVQDDGKILVVGTTNNGYNLDFALVRYNSDGTLDTSFDGDGIVTTNFDSYQDIGSAVTLQPDHKILLAGQSKNGFAVLRYNSDGSLDSSFGTPINTLNNTAYYYEGSNYSWGLASGVQVVDAELAAQGNYAGASVSLSRHGGANNDDHFSGNGFLYFNGSNAELGGINIGTVNNSNGTLAITFNSNATQARVSTALSLIEYSNSSDNPPETLQIDWLFNDGNTGAQGTGGALAALGSSTVNITAVNDAPVLDTPAVINYVDTAVYDNFLPVAGTLTATDVDSKSMTYGISDGTDNGDGTVTKSNAYGILTVNQTTGDYSFTPKNFVTNKLNADKSLAFSVTVRDESYYYGNKTLVINISQSGITESKGDDTITASSGNDVIIAFTGDDTVSGGDGDDDLSGCYGNDILSGGNGNDVLRGHNGDDTLIGGAGDDVLKGRTENDTLTGGLGKDIFCFNSPYTDNIDNITDFTPVDDTIELQNSIFTSLTKTGILAPNHFAIAAAAVDNNDYLVYNNATGALFYDADGNGVGMAAQIAILGKAIALTNADFVVV